jgi:hypothetical protein
MPSREYRSDSGGQFEAFKPALDQPWPLIKATRKPELKIMHHDAVGVETLPAFRRRMLDQFQARLREYCRYLRGTRLLPGTMPRLATRDAWFAAEFKKGKTVRAIQEAYFEEGHELVSEPAIRKAIQRVRTKPGRS